MTMETSSTASLEKVVPMVDKVDRRIDLARAVVALRDQGRISPKLAAMAVFELDRPDSVLFMSSVAESIARFSRKPDDERVMRGIEHGVDWSWRPLGRVSAKLDPCTPLLAPERPHGVVHLF